MKPKQPKSKPRLKPVAKLKKHMLGKKLESRKNKAVRVIIVTR